MFAPAMATSGALSHHAVLALSLKIHGAASFLICTSFMRHMLGRAGKDGKTSRCVLRGAAAFFVCLQELAQGRTSIFVAHRLSTVRTCNKIVVMEGGKVVEQGTHEV